MLLITKLTGDLDVASVSVRLVRLLLLPIVAGLQVLSMMRRLRLRRAIDASLRGAS